MKRLSLVAVAGLAAALAGSIALAQPAKDNKPATPGAMQPSAKPSPDGKKGAEHAPPGMSEADMKACMEAGTPGPMHEYLAQSVGMWTGKTKMWMAPGTEPSMSECTATITSIMDGRFVKCEVAGEIPGMGPFKGGGVSGYDNVAKQFQTTWIDNCGTGIMFGTGEKSSDGQTMTWKLTYNCPIAKKPVVMRQVERHTGKDTMTLEMFGPDPHSGKEFKMMEIAYTRKAGAMPMDNKPMGTR